MDPIQENNQNDAKTIGSLLKMARINQKLTLKAIAQHTKINKTILEHLENDNLDDLPNKAYVSGFVKSYAKALGIPQHLCLDLLNKAYHITSSPLDVENTNIPFEQVQDEQRNNDDPAYSQASTNDKQIPVLNYMISFAAIIGGLFFYLQHNDNEDSVAPILAAKVAVPIGTKSLTHQTPLHHKPAPATQSDEQVRPSNVEVSKVDKPVEASDAKKTKAPIVSAVASNSHELSLEKSKILQSEKITDKQEPVITDTTQLAPAKIKVSEETTKKIEVKETTPADKLVQSEQKKPSKKFYKVNRVLYRFTSSDVAKITEEFLPAKFKVQNQKQDMHSLFVSSIKGDTWITYKNDDNPIKKFILKKDRNILINGKRIRIFFGNVNNTRIFLDNRPLDIFSKTGVKSIIFPQENKSEFYFPLFVFENNNVLTSDEYMLKMGYETSFLNQN